MEADFWKQECNFVIYKGYFQTNGMLEYLWQQDIKQAIKPIL